jgi:hypothetical protein
MGGSGSEEIPAGAADKFAHELAPGDAIAPRRFCITGLANQQRLFAQEDFHPRYLPGPGGEPELVHPVLVLQMLANTSSPSYRVPADIGPVLAEARTTFIEPLRVGRPYIASWRLVRCYAKRGRDYHEIEAEITEADGKPAVRRTLHVTYSKHSA